MDMGKLVGEVGAALKKSDLDGRDKGGFSRLEHSH